MKMYSLSISRFHLAHVFHSVTPVSLPPLERRLSVRIHLLICIVSKFIYISSRKKFGLIICATYLSIVCLFVTVNGSTSTVCLFHGPFWARDFVRYNDQGVRILQFTTYLEAVKLSTVSLPSSVSTV